ncbi:MAG: hypothetical protein ACTSPH_12270 [Promethearchaeota archaeon]
MITIPASATSDLLASVSGLISDFWVLIALAISIPLFFYVVKKIAGLFPKR